MLLSLVFLQCSFKKYIDFSISFKSLLSVVKPKLKKKLNQTFFVFCASIVEILKISNTTSATFSYLIEWTIKYIDTANSE